MQLQVSSDSELKISFGGQIESYSIFIHILNTSDFEEAILRAQKFFAMTSIMTISDAQVLISQCATRLNILGGEVVFDEWALVTLNSAGAQLAGYGGPRVESFKARFVTDVRPLKIELEGRKLEVGNFAFASDAEGTGYDACVRVGPSAYLWWNNTHATMTKIRASGAWLPAQKLFVDLCEVFRRDPVVEN